MTKSGRPAPVRIPLYGLFFIAVVAALDIAASLLIPIVISVLLSLLLSPAVRTMTRRRVPAALTSAILVAAIVSLLVAVVSSLASPAEEWLKEAPRSLGEIKSQMFVAKGKLSDIQELAEEVDQLASVDSASGAQEVVVRGPGLLEEFAGGLPTLLVSSGIIVFLTYFLLASEDGLIRRATKCGRSWTTRRRIVTATREIQSAISRYLLTVTLINIVLGALVAGVMLVLDVPNPLLWGAMATLFNFAPYAGALASTIVLTLVGFTTFSTLGDAILVPGSFLVLTVLEGQLITPIILGRRLSLSPIVVLVAVIFWGWLWGVAGALIAVPIVTGMKIIFDHIPELAFVGDMLRTDRGRGNGDLLPLQQVRDAPHNAPTDNLPHR